MRAHLLTPKGPPLAFSFPIFPFTLLFKNKYKMLKQNPKSSGVLREALSHFLSVV